MKRLAVLILVLLSVMSTAIAAVDMHPLGIPLITQIGDVDTSGVTKDQVIKFNGSSWVAADYDYSFVYVWNTFTDDVSNTYLLGSGVWDDGETGDITFSCTYDNGPPDSLVVVVSGDFDDSGTGWTDDTLTFAAGAKTSQATLEDLNYPDDSGDVMTFTGTDHEATDKVTTVTFYNYFIYDDFASNTGFDDADLDTIAASGTQIITGDHTRTFTQSVGGSNYLVFAHRKAGTTIAQVYAGSGGDRITVAMNKDDATTKTPLKETISHSNAATNAKTEDFYVYASLMQNVDAHSNSFTTTTSGTVNNYQRWGLRDDTSWVDAEILGLANNGFANSTDNSRSDFGNLTPEAGNYIIYACPSRLSDLAHTTAFRFDGVTAAFENDATVSVTNECGFVENYRVYRSTDTDIGEGSGELETDGGSTVLNFMYFGSDTGDPVNEAQIEDMDTKASSDGFTNGRQIKSTETETVTFGPAGVGEYVWYCYPKRLGTASVTIDGIPGGFQSPVTIASITNVNGYVEDYYGYRSDFTANVEKTYVWTGD